MEGIFVVLHRTHRLFFSKSMYQHTHQMSSSLGDRSSQRPPKVSRSINIPPAPEPAVPAVRFAILRKAATIPRGGFLPMLFVSSLFAVATSMFAYNGISDVDYSEDMPRVLTIGTAVLGTFFILIARNPVLLFNIALFAHLGFEIFVVDKVWQYAMASDTSTSDMTIAYTGAGLVIVHLIPFFLIDNAMTLILLAAVGIIVNNLVILMSVPAFGSSLLMPVGLTSAILLGVTQHICGEMESKCSLLTVVRTEGFLTM